MTDKIKIHSNLLKFDLDRDVPILESEKQHTITVMGKEYTFSDYHVKRYPKLLDTRVNYLLGFDKLLPLVLGYPETALDPTLFDQDHEKEIFLTGLEFLEIKLEPKFIIHLSQSFMKELEDCREYILKKTGKKGKHKMRFLNDKRVLEFCEEQLPMFEKYQSKITPSKILKLLELGTKESLEKLILKNFDSNNLVKTFISNFLRIFL